MLLPFCEQAEWEPWSNAVRTDPQVHTSYRVTRMGDKRYEPRWDAGWVAWPHFWQGDARPEPVDRHVLKLAAGHLRCQGRPVLLRDLG